MCCDTGGGRNHRVVDLSLAICMVCNTPNTENLLSCGYESIKTLNIHFLVDSERAKYLHDSSFSWGQLLDKVFSVSERWLIFFKTSFKYCYSLL